MGKIKKRKIVIVNQAANYLTVDLCNAFAKKFETVDLITGNVHEQGEVLSDNVNITFINKYKRSPKSRKFLSYLIATIRIYFLIFTRYRTYEVFFISTPPMAYLLAIAIPNRVSMLIWDVYPDIFKITGMSESHLIYRIWAFLNRIAFKKAYKLFTIGQRMAKLIEKYVSREKIIITPIWSIFQSNIRIKKNENPFITQNNLENKFIVQYSGNIGLTHNVEVLIDIATSMKEREEILFLIIGKGSRVPYLKQMVSDRDLKNCRLLPFQPDEMFPYSLSAADLGVVILDDETSKGSVPSKSYNLMSFGIPSLYIAAEDSELHDYTDQYNHAECFHKTEIESISEFIIDLEDNKEMRKQYSENALKAAKNFRRSNADDIVDIYLK